MIARLRGTISIYTAFNQGSTNCLVPDFSIKFKYFSDQFVDLLRSQPLMKFSRRSSIDTTRSLLCIKKVTNVHKAVELEKKSNHVVHDNDQSSVSA